MNEQNHQWSLSLRYLVFGVVSIILVIALWLIRSILEPIVIAAFIAYLIHPAVNFLINRTRLSRTAAVNLVYFITLGVLIGTPSTLTPIFFDQFKQETNEILNITNQLIAWLVETKCHPRYSL